MAHVKACILDPGTVPLPSTRIDFSDLHANEKGAGYDQDEEWSVCTRCETYRYNYYFFKLLLQRLPYKFGQQASESSPLPDLQKMYQKNGKYFIVYFCLWINHTIIVNIF